MVLRSHRLLAPLRGLRRSAQAQAQAPAPAADCGEPGPAAPAREPDHDLAASAAPDLGWRASSYDLQQGLDVVELPTSLPAEVLDRLFSAAAK
jgi:hypothetical protein